MEPTDSHGLAFLDDNSDIARFPATVMPVAHGVFPCTDIPPPPYSQQLLFNSLH